MSPKHLSSNDETFTIPLHIATQRGMAEMYSTTVFGPVGWISLQLQHDLKSLQHHSKLHEGWSLYNHHRLIG